MYCGERYPTLSHVSICPCDKFSNIPPSENTDNKIVSNAQSGGDSVGVVDSVGDTLSVYAFCANEVDEVGLYEHQAALTQPEPIKKRSFIDDDIPPIFAESGIFSRAE